jgi:hypothetical protein
MSLGKTKGWRDANSTVDRKKANKHGCGTGLNERKHINRRENFGIVICKLLFTAVGTFRTQGLHNFGVQTSRNSLFPENVQREFGAI